MGTGKKGRGLGAWLLALVMICSLVTVPAKSVEAAEVSYDLSVKSGYSGTSVTMAKNTYGTDYIGDVLFDIPTQAATKSAITSNGLTKMEVKLTVQSFTPGGGETPKVMAYVQPGEDGDWKWNQSVDVELATGKQLTVTYDLSSIDWNGGSTTGNMGIRFANCANGSKVSFTIDSAKLIGQAWDVENDDISLSYTAQDQYESYMEYKFTVKNDGSTAVNGNLVITFDKAREKNWWTENFTIGLSSDKKTLTVSNLSVPAGGSSEAIQVQLKPMGAAITSVSFAGKTISASGTTLGATSGGGGGSTTDDFTGSTTYTVPDDCVDDAAETPLEKHGKLHVDMNTLKLTDANGNPYQLRGVSSHGINWDGNGEYEYEYINFKSIKNVRDILNADAIRLAMYTKEYNGYTTGVSTDKLKYRVDKGVQCATALGMYAIVDWHILNANPKDNITEAKEFFEYASKRYSGYDNVLYEICNEPTSGIWLDIKSYAETIVPIIKKNDPDAVIIVGTPTWSQDVDIVKDNPLKDADGTLTDNVMYTIHFYANEHRDSYRNKLRAALGKIPIFCTEYGMTMASGDGANNFTEATAWLDLLDENCISYFVWNLSEKSENSSLILHGSNTWDSWTASNLSESGKWIKEQYANRRAINNSSAVSVNSVTLNKTSLTLKEGASEILEATVDPSGTVKWTSDKPSVATVDSSGKVTAVGVGTANITASAGGKSANCTVTVEAAPTAKLETDKTSFVCPAQTYGDTFVAASMTITNSGEVSATGITVSLKKGSKSEFSAGISANTIPADGTANITITPKAGLVAGSYEDTIVITYNNGKSNTTLSIPVSLTVNKRNITIKAENKTKTYGEENPEWSYEVTSGSLVKGDSLDIEYSTTATKTSDAGSYPITVSAGSDPNYNITTVNGTLTIEKKPVSRVDFPIASDIKVGDSLGDSELTEGDEKYGSFAWENPELVPEKGIQDARVVLTLDDAVKKNYSFDAIEGYDSENGTITQEVSVWVQAANAPKIVFPTAGAIQYGQTLNDADLIYSEDSLNYGSFAWVDGDTPIEVIGENLKFDMVFTPSPEAVAEYELIERKQKVTVKVGKADNTDDPETPELVKRTSNSIQVQAADGYEYSKDGGNTWQSSNTFTKLSPFTKYSITARIKETETHNASRASSAIIVYTLVNDPYVIDVSKIDDENYREALCKADGQTTIEYSGGTLTLTDDVSKHSEGYTITGNNPSVTIQAATDTKITLLDATVKAVKVTGTGSAEITISGDVEVKDTISSSENAQIILNGNGTLKTSGIISNGSVTIKSGTLTIDASGTDHAAIKAPTVVIEGGTVEAVGGSGSPAIEGDNITISGGTVTATGGNGSAAISGGEVNIKDATVTATGGEGAPAISGTKVSIKDSNVTANAGKGASAIESTGQIKIDDSKVEVKIEEGSGKSAISSDDIVIAGDTIVSSPNKDIKLYSSTPKDENGNELTEKRLVTKITLDSTNKTLKVGDKVALKATVQPSNASDSSVVWTSSNTKVATVDQKGNVTGAAPGTAVITVKAKDASGKYATCNVTVVQSEPEEVHVEKIKITGATKKVAPGKKITLKAVVYPENATNKAVKWTVSNQKYASVNNQGVVKTKKAGKGKKVTVTATSLEDGSIKAVYKISIMKKPVKKIKLSAKKTTLKKKQSVTIKAKFTPSKGISKELTWTSSNPKVATVNAKGKVVAKKKGKAKITAKAKDGSGKKATITIKVK
ncbi:MAG: Ig-like domain-containing protein [Lachnospiraceae bacterium]|nr:Ig-like domain-containing protein [Lachnospiraceae bacterium]